MNIIGRWYGAGVALVAGGLLALPQAAAAADCGTTWTTACASVSVNSSGNTVIFGVSNVSTGDSQNSLFGWLMTEVEPEAVLTSFSVFANCSAGADPSDPSSLAANCDDVSGQWAVKTNNQGGVEWTAGTSSEQGNTGIVSETGTCSKSGTCWTGPVFFVMHFDRNIDAVNGWTVHAQRLGPDGEESEWITNVPEPLTTTLFGLGLAGWAGVEARRRRRENGEFDEDAEI